MKNFIFVVFILSLSKVFGQTDSILIIDQNNFANSIQLFIVNDISAGYNHMLSDKSVLNISVEISGGFLSEDSDRKVINSSGSTTKTEESREDEIQSYYLVSLFKYYLYDDAELKLFLGMGPIMGYNFIESVFRREDNRTSIFRSRTISAGISVNSGIEYNLTDRFLLIAEYRFQASYEWSFNKNISKSDSKTTIEWDIRRTRYDLKNIRIGIGFRI